MESSRIVLAGLALAFACGGSSGSNQERHPGQTSFESSPGFLEPPGDRTAPMLPAFAEVEEPPGATALSELRIDGWDPRVFRNGSLLYVLSEMMVDRVHTPGESYSRWGVVLHVLDLSGARVRLRSRLVLPAYWPDYVRLPGPGWRNDNAELLTTSPGTTQCKSRATPWR